MKMKNYVHFFYQRLHLSIKWNNIWKKCVRLNLLNLFVLLHKNYKLRLLISFHSLIILLKFTSFRRDLNFISSPIVVLVCAKILKFYYLYLHGFFYFLLHLNIPPLQTSKPRDYRIKELMLSMEERLC